MDEPLIPNRLCCQQICTLYTLKRFCLFLLFLALFSIIAVAIAALPVILLMKPRQPIFNFQSLQLDWYNISLRSGSPFLSSVFTLNLDSRNPNKIGIKYNPSRLLVVCDGNGVVGTIRVPEVFQPPRSEDRRVRTRVLLHRFDVDLFDAMGEFVALKIIGDVGVELFVFHVAVVKMKVALSCNVDVDWRVLKLRDEIIADRGGTVLKALDSYASPSKTMSTMCDVSFYL